ncbi:MAG TPA: serine/threonine-protein kinase [Myxococcaceae bacterium]|jgi:hypothetical protein
MSRLLGQSDTGYTYQALADDGAQVVVKELCFASTPSAQDVEAFEREGQLLKRLRHPRLPRYRDSFREGEGPGLRLYLVYDFVVGHSLFEELQAHRYTEAEAYTLAQRILEILRYLHQLAPPVIHRDIKPQNLIRRPDGTVVLVDFGAARELANGTTASATVVGTFGYMPLEQLGGIVDETSDLYALGATLVHLLALRPPWELLVPGRGILLEGAVPVSPAFRKFLERLMAPRGERFASAAEALAALEERPSLARGGARRWGLVAGVALAVGGGLFLVRGPLTAPAPVTVSRSVAALPRPQPVARAAPALPAMPPSAVPVAPSSGTGATEAPALSLRSPGVEPAFAAPTVLASGQSGPSRLVVHQGFAYWTNRQSGEVMRVSVEGGNPEPIITGQQSPGPLWLGGPRGRFLYWVQTPTREPQRVFRWPLTGGAPEELFIGESVEVLAVSGNTLVYRAGGKLMAREQGKPARVVLSQAADLEALMVVPPWVYFSSGSQPLLSRVRLDGRQRQVVMHGEGALATAFAVNSQYVFWSDVRSRSIYRVPRAGGRASVVASNATAHALAADEQFVYLGTSEVSRVPVSGGVPEALTLERQGGGALTVDEKALYWLDFSWNRVMRMAKP